MKEDDQVVELKVEHARANEGDDALAGFCYWGGVARRI